MRKGKFIVFEGMDGAGKSTQIKLLSEYLKCKNIEHICTSDLGSTEFGAKIRELFLDEKYNLAKKTEVLLMLAAREEHINKVIVPALNSGKIVLCDRFVYSTLAYQLFDKDAIVEDMVELVEEHLCACPPDKAILLDISVDDMKKRKLCKDRIESKGVVFYEYVQERYLNMYDWYYDIEKIDATQSTEVLHKAVLASLKDII